MGSGLDYSSSSLQGCSDDEAPQIKSSTAEALSVDKNEIENVIESLQSNKIAWYGGVTLMDHYSLISLGSRIKSKIELYAAEIWRSKAEDHDLFLKKRLGKRSDQISNHIFGATAPRRMGFTENFQRLAGEESIPTWILTKQDNQSEFMSKVEKQRRWPRSVAKSMVSARLDFRGLINRNTSAVT